MAEEATTEGVLKEQEPPVSIEEVEKLFAELVDQMSAATKHISLLGKRVRFCEEAPDVTVETLEKSYLSLPVSSRPSWFEYVASQQQQQQSVQDVNNTKKFAPTTAPAPTDTQYGHTQ